MSRKISKQKYHISSKIFHLAREGEAEESYADSYYPQTATTINNQSKKRDSIRLAVGDGVSESYGSASWSAYITELFCKQGMDFLQSNQFIETINKWKDFETNKARLRFADDSELLEIFLKKIHGPLNDRNNISNSGYITPYGGSTTFCGLEISLKKKHVLCLNIGDSCFFILRNGKVFGMQPELNVSEFNYTPEQITTRDTLSTERQISLKSYRIKRNDILILGTDAISKWLINSSDKSFSKKISEIMGLKSQNEFAQYIHDKHRQKADALDNDDVTLVVLQIR